MYSGATFREGLEASACRRGRANPGLSPFPGMGAGGIIAWTT
jgi:hypothetical protein